MKIKRSVIEEAVRKALKENFLGEEQPSNYKIKQSRALESRTKKIKDVLDNFQSSLLEIDVEDRNADSQAEEIAAAWDKVFQTQVRGKKIRSQKFSKPQVVTVTGYDADRDYENFVATLEVMDNKGRSYDVMWSEIY